MKTYEEIIADNPDACFFVEGIDYYCCKDYTLKEELTENFISFGNDKPEVYLAINPHKPEPWEMAEFGYFKDDIIRDYGEQINIDNLWKELQNDN